MCSRPVPPQEGQPRESEDTAISAQDEAAVQPGPQSAADPGGGSPREMARVRVREFFHFGREGGGRQADFPGPIFFGSKAGDAGDCISYAVGWEHLFVHNLQTRTHTTQTFVCVLVPNTNGWSTTKVYFFLASRNVSRDWIDYFLLSCGR